jgi:hypothetical protein
VLVSPTALEFLDDAAKKTVSFNYLKIQYAMKAYGGVNILIHIFLTSVLVGCQWSASSPGRFTPQERALVYIG